MTDRGVLEERFIKIEEDQWRVIAVDLVNKCAQLD
jgi:hypothetical protein